jgi:hypothetical protein
MKPDYVVGLDLGQASDFTALAVLERPPPAPTPTPREEPIYSVRHLQRFPLGTPYTTIVPAVACLLGTEPLKGCATLVVDQTGVGRALVDMLRRAPVPGRMVPVTITGGQAVTVAEDGSRHVPKKELVTCLQLLLQGRRLQVARTLPDAELLVRELQNFRVKITGAAHETFGAWRDGEHDDLVLAVALASWLANREPRRTANAFTCGPSRISQAPNGVFHAHGEVDEDPLLHRSRPGPTR